MVLRRGDRSLLYMGQWSKKCVVGSTSAPHLHNGFKESWKLCLNLCSRRWLRSYVSIIYFTFILILFLLCLFCCYPRFQCVYKSSTLFLYSCVLILLYILFSCQYIHICCLRHNSSGCAFWANCLARSFWEISTYKIIFSKVSDLFFTSIYFSIEANTKFPD